MAEPALGVAGRGCAEGAGQFGVELVEGDGAAGTGLARAARDELRNRGVLVGTTRREQNVLKVRPPLCISRDEAALIVSTLDEVLAPLEGAGT